MTTREAIQRRKVAKKLSEQISLCTDPNLLLELTKQYNAVKPKKAANKPEPAEKNQAPSGPQSTFKKSDYTHCPDWLEKQPMGKREYYRLLFGLEAAPGYSRMTSEEKRALIERMQAGFSDAERAALEAYAPAEDRG